MANRFRISVPDSIFSALLFLIFVVWRPGWVWSVLLGSLAFVAVRVLWNFDGLRKAWREDLEAKRNA